MSRRLLLVQPHGERGGAEVVMLNFLRFLDRSRFEPTVAMLREGPLEGELRPLAGRLEIIPVGRVRELQRSLPAMARLAGLARSSRADLVCGWCTSGQAYASAAALLAGKASAWFEHGGTVNTPLARVGASLPSSMLVWNSEWTRDRWLRAYPHLHRREQRVIHPGVDLEALGQGLRAQARIRMGVPAEALVVGMVGRLQRWKGQDLFLEALALARTRHPELHAVLVGAEMFGLDAGFGESLRARAEVADLRGAVSFIGFQNDTAGLWSGMDIVVHCSRDPEPFGQVVFEALAAGVAVIAADQGGPAELLHDGIDALLRPAQARPLAEALVTLAGDSSLRARLGRAGQVLVREGLGAEAMTRSLEAAFEAGIGSR